MVFVDDSESLSLVEGWLRVCEYEVLQVPHGSEDHRALEEVEWHPGFCVYREDDSSFICYKTEQAAEIAFSVTKCKGRVYARSRIDGGYAAFYRRWGYMSPLPVIRRSCMPETISLHEGILAQYSDGSNSFEDVRSSTLPTQKRVRIDTSYDLIENRTESLDRRRQYFSPSLQRKHQLMSPVSEPPDFEGDVTPPSQRRLSNFLSRQLVLRGLKRTKSVSKLDRARRSGINQFGQNSPYQPVVPTPGCDSVRSSRSHESLLSHSTHMMDLGPGQGVQSPEIVALHPSVLHTPNCFQISCKSNGAVKYYACRSAAERDRWMEWYFCELTFDKTLYARTSSKPKGDLCFWGEYFEFSHLPTVDVICVNLYKEGDRKKRRDRGSSLVGFVNIPVSVLVGKQPVERWYTVTNGERQTQKADCPAIRLKARYQSIKILPVKFYNTLSHFIESRYLSLCSALEPLLSAKCKEDLATCLVHVAHHQRFVKDFLCDLVMQEVNKLDNDHLMFRGNSLATKAMEAYMKLICGPFLQDTLGDFVRSLVEAEDDCEVDPVRVQNNTQLEKNRKTLSFYVEIAWGKIINSVHYFPTELRQVFCCIRQRLFACGRDELADNIISSSIFLRFLCPAILSPSLFGLMTEYPSERSGRGLTLVAKTVQTLANFSKFGGKEQYMEFMNLFVDREWDSMRDFLSRISSPLQKDQYIMESSGIVDLGKELSLLHSHLVECLNTFTKQPQGALEDLSMILNNITEALNNPCTYSTGASLGNMGVQKNKGSPLSPISDYDNNIAENGGLMHHSVHGSAPCSSSTSSDSPASSPTTTTSSERSQAHILSSSEKDARSTFYITANEGRETPPCSSESRRNKAPAQDLNTSDDYVLYSALDENLGLRAGEAAHKHRIQKRAQQTRRAATVLGSERQHFADDVFTATPLQRHHRSSVMGISMDALSFADAESAGSSNYSTTSNGGGSFMAAKDGVMFASAQEILHFEDSGNTSQDSGGVEELEPEWITARSPSLLLQNGPGLSADPTSSEQVALLGSALRGGGGALQPQSKQLLKGSQNSLASSSGYHSLPISSNGNSPVESSSACESSDFTAAASAKGVSGSSSSERGQCHNAKSQVVENNALSFANPLYSIQRTPMIFNDDEMTPRPSSAETTPTGPGAMTYAIKNGARNGKSGGSSAQSIDSVPSTSIGQQDDSFRKQAQQSRNPLLEAAKQAFGGNKAQGSPSLSPVNCVHYTPNSSPRKQCPPPDVIPCVPNALEVPSPSLKTKHEPLQRQQHNHPNGCGSHPGKANGAEGQARLFVQQHKPSQRILTSTPCSASSGAVGSATRTAPRTNPRVSGPSISRSPRLGMSPRTGIRRTTTDSVICVHSKEPSTSSVMSSCDYGEGSIYGGVSSDSVLSEDSQGPSGQNRTAEMEEMRRQLEDFKAKLREAEEREQEWKTKFYEQKAMSPEGQRKTTLREQGQSDRRATDGNLSFTVMFDPDPTSEKSDQIESLPDLQKSPTRNFGKKPVSKLRRISEPIPTNFASGRKQLMAQQQLHQVQNPRKHLTPINFASLKSTDI